jgi:hypothetical protein
MKALKIYLVIFLLAICFTTTQILFTMEKKKEVKINFNKNSVLYNVVKDKTFQRFSNLTTKLLFTYDDSKNRSERLIIAWQEVFQKTTLKRIIHKNDNAMYVEANITDATRILEAYFSPQLESRTIQRILNGEISPTGIYIQKPEHHNPAQTNILYKGLCGLALITAGWVSKSLWDAGGKKYTFLCGNYLFQQLIERLDHLI